MMSISTYQINDMIQPAPPATLRLEKTRAHLQTPGGSGVELQMHNGLIEITLEDARGGAARRLKICDGQIFEDDEAASDDWLDEPIAI